jgi:hypothetical protein
MLGALVLSTQLGIATAPADRYFGRLKMSALRIRYETMQLKNRYESHQLLPDQAEHLVLLNEDAYRDWARRYPQDPWLASTGYAMAQLYAELPGTGARDHAAALLGFVKSHFPATPYARESRDWLHRGVAVRPQPEWARASSTPPGPSSAPSPTPAGPSSTPAAPRPPPTAVGTNRSANGPIRPKALW